METKVIIITDFDYFNENLKCTRSIHYCVEFENPTEDDETLFEKACEILKLEERGETVAEWFID